MSISALRNQNSLDKLLQQVQKDESPATEKKSYVDERLWKPNVDKAGNGYAVIRFLPAPKGEELLVGSCLESCIPRLLDSGILRILLPHSIRKTQ